MSSVVQQLVSDRKRMRSILTTFQRTFDISHGSGPIAAEVLLIGASERNGKQSEFKTSKYSAISPSVHYGDRRESADRLYQRAASTRDSD
jgi:hypothetical protein